MFTIKVKQSRPPVKGDGLMVTSLIISYKTYLFLRFQNTSVYAGFGEGAVTKNRKWVTKNRKWGNRK